MSEQLPKKWPFTSSSVSASPNCRTVAPAESSTSISSGRVSGGHVVDERHPLVEEVAPARLDVAPHPIARACAATPGRR